MAKKTVTVVEDLARVAERCKALADPVRLRILDRLPRTCDCDSVLNVSELAEALALPQSTVSRHLAVLRRSGLVSSERMCRDVYYWADGDVLASAAASVAALGRGGG